MKYYVYVYRDPRPTKHQQPVYVGKGSGDRDMFHWFRESHNKPMQDFKSHLKREGLEPIVERVFTTDVEQEAFNEEIRLIALYGRRNLRTGSLFNLTDGGEGGAGSVRTRAMREVDRAISMARWKQSSYRELVLRRQLESNARPEVRKKKAGTSRMVWVKVGHVMAANIAAARATPESRAKTSEQAKAQWGDPAYAEKMRLIKAEIDARPEVSEARARKLKSKWDDPAERAARVAAMKAAAKTKYRAVHAMPEDKIYDSVTALLEATGMVKSTAYAMLKGKEFKQGAFAGWTLKYV